MISKLTKLLMVCTFIFVAPALLFAGDIELPEGVVAVDTEDAGMRDQGYPTTAGAVSGDKFFLGREHGFRVFDRNTLEWEFVEYDNTVCPGYGTINIDIEGELVWTRLTNTGVLCGYNLADQSWDSFHHWTVKEHTGPGNFFHLEEDRVLVASSGSPDWEGVSIIDRNSGEWMKLLKTKPASAFYVDGNTIWMGVPEGILKIDLLTENYSYFQPFEHGGGAMVKDILPIPGGLAFATIGDSTGIIGDKIIVKKNSIQVYIESSDSWYTYDKNERKKLLNDLNSGKIFVTNIKTNPGLLIMKDNNWVLLDEEDGLPFSEILDLDSDEKFLYLASAKGIAVVDIETLSPVVINNHMFNMMKRVRRVISDEEYLWVFSIRELYRIEKRMLFSQPR